MGLVLSHLLHLSRNERLESQEVQLYPVGSTTVSSTTVASVDDCRGELYRVSRESEILVWNFNSKRNIAVKLLHLCSFQSLFIQLSYVGKTAADGYVYLSDRI